jgi:2-keto-4-pentenoate hydratase/2-oxohepta-3-ene-1,7-dioic acid hydratase in catechol pathway
MSAFGLANIIVDGAPVLAASFDGVLHPVHNLVDGGPSSFDEALERWDQWVEAIEVRLDAFDLPAGLDAASADYRPAGAAAPVLWCAGANYTDHVAEMGATDIVKRSFHFLSPPSVRNTHGGTVVRPTGVQQFDWEVELAAVVGRPARHVSAADALEYVAGYTVANDVSVRDPDRVRHPIFGMDWTAAKNADGLTPVGPAVVPARFVPDPGHLDLGLTVNGVVRQKSNTSRMIVDLAEQIEALSALVTLRPGDFVLTGTPAGTAAGHNAAYLVDGDVMVASIATIGSLTNVVG